MRPPPSLTQSPLNLQIQLLAPSQNQRRDTNLSAQTLSRRSSTSSSYSGIAGGSRSKLAAGAGANSASASGGSLDAIAQASISGVDRNVERREGSSATAGAASASGAVGGGRKRSGSVGSHRSGMSSTGTGSSMHSASSMRRVLPVYNLTFSSLLGNVVTDAGAFLTMLHPPQLNWN